MASSYHDFSIHDNVHGSIGLSKAEYRIVNTLAFQRLRKIKQLGLASLVFPGADHTRFSHSLGVLNIMGKMSNVLLRKKIIINDDVRKLRMAALLHDIGHYPLSHVIENVYKKRRKLIIKPVKVSTTSKLSSAMVSSFEDKRYGHHERLGAKVITERAEVKEILINESFDPDEIAKIINGEHQKHPIYCQLLHSSLDADRIDYLLRDSHLTGVSYGKIDSDYLLNHLDVDKESILGVKFKGQHAVEHFLIARYFMYSQVVHHKTITGFEAIAKALFHSLADEKIVYCDFEKIQEIVNTDDFLNFNDDYFFSKVDFGYASRTKFKKMDPDIYEKYFLTLRNRKPLKLIREEKIFFNKAKTSIPPSYTSFITRINDRLSEEIKKYEKRMDETLFYELGFSFEGLAPFYSLSSDHPGEEIRELIMIINKKGKATPLIKDENSVLHHLSQLQMKVARLYLLDLNNDDKMIGRIQRSVAKW